MIVVSMRVCHGERKPAVCQCNNEERKSNLPTDTTLLTESADMLTKEAEMMREMESMDQSEMTTAEAAYYLEVMARINQKLASVL